MSQLFPFDLMAFCYLVSFLILLLLTTFLPQPGVDWPSGVPGDARWAEAHFWAGTGGVII